MPKAKEKGDDEKLVYAIDWSDWLATNSDSIDTSTWSVPTGLTSESTSATADTTRIKLSGGTIGQTYEVTNVITTVTTDETAERSFKVKIVEHKYK